MYLGANKIYLLSINVEIDNPCLIAFQAQNDEVRFSSVEIIANPNSGRLSATGKFSYTYVAQKHNSSDNFSLKVCGSDSAGTGCDTLNYSATVQ